VLYSPIHDQLEVLTIENCNADFAEVIISLLVLFGVVDLGEL
jgi:uncharacterized membrane protein